jgi:hypothetical protein
MGGIFKLLTSSYVQNGLNTNTAALKQLAEADVVSTDPDVLHTSTSQCGGAAE